VGIARGYALKALGSTVVALAPLVILASTDPAVAAPFAQPQSVSTRGTLVQLNGAVVTKVLLGAHRIDVVRKGTNVAYVIRYSATTVFYGSRPTSIVQGTMITVAGILKGTTIWAQKVSTKRPSSPVVSGIGTPNYGASGPYVGVKYVGNV
jgi:hypothetical protein